MRIKEFNINIFGTEINLRIGAKNKLIEEYPNAPVEEVTSFVDDYLNLVPKSLNGETVPIEKAL